MSDRAPPRRILRIGIVMGGTIVEERLLRERTPVTIGQGTRNTFCVPVEALPRTFTMFALDEGRCVLRFTADMDGRINNGDRTATLAELRGATPDAGGYHQLALADTARGKVALGDLAVLFQLVPEPPLLPQPRLPASLRGRISDRIDPRLATILIASLVLHVGFACYSLVADADTDEPLAELVQPSTFHQDVLDITAVDPPTPPAQSAVAAPVVAVATPRHVDHPTARDPGAARPRRWRAARSTPARSPRR